MSEPLSREELEEAIERLRRPSAPGEIAHDTYKEFLQATRTALHYLDRVAELEKKNEQLREDLALAFRHGWPTIPVRDYERINAVLSASGEEQWTSR